MSIVELGGRAKLLALEAAIAAEEQCEIPVKHHFAPGIYMREITIAPGTTLTGKIHKHAHLNIIAKGDITVVTEEGKKRIKAPAVILSPPGCKRAGYAHKETVWITVHQTDTDDLEAIEAEHIAPSFEAYIAFAQALALTHEKKDGDE